MRAVLDPNVIISALLSPRGTPARILLAWLDGAFELVVSEKLIAELERALAYPKLRARISAEDAAELIELLAQSAADVEDPPDPAPVRSPDPGDDYLVSSAQAASAVLVSGDKHLLGLKGRIPVYAAAEFLAVLEAGP